MPSVGNILFIKLRPRHRLKFHCPFLPVNSNKTHIFHKAVGRETFHVYPDLDSGSSRRLYGHAGVCARTGMPLCTQRLPVAAQPWDPWETVIRYAKSTPFPKWWKWVIWWLCSQLEPARSQHGVTLEIGCSNLGGAQPSWVRLRSQVHPNTHGQPEVHPNTHGQPVITSPVRASDIQSIYCTRCLGECFLFKTVFTSPRNPRRKALLQRAFCSRGLRHWERFSSVLEVTQLDMGGAGQRARPAWLQSRGGWLWRAPCGLSEPRQSFLTRSRLLFVAHGLKNRWLLEILQVPWDPPPWNVKAAKFKPGALGARETAGIFFTRTDEVRDGTWNLWLWEWLSPLMEHHLYFRPWTPGVMEVLKVSTWHRYPPYHCTGEHTQPQGDKTASACR